MFLSVSHQRVLRCPQLRTTVRGVITLFYKIEELKTGVHRMHEDLTENLLLLLSGAESKFLHPYLAGNSETATSQCLVGS